MFFPMALDHSATAVGRQRESAAMVSRNYNQPTVAVDKPGAIVARRASVYLLAGKKESRRQ